MKNDYYFKDDYVGIIVLRKGVEYHYLIDKEDLNIVDSYSGTYHRGNDGYCYASILVAKNKRKSIAIHRMIMKPKEDEVVDHLNRNSLDNRRTNLRVIEKGANAQNISIYGNKRNTSGHRNICIRGKKFEVQIKGVMLGKYDTLEEALEVRDKNLEILQPYAYESYKFKPSS